MHAIGDIVNSLNRSVMYIKGLQSRFELPVFQGAKYSDAYLNFLRNIVYLRIMNIGEDTLRDLWRIEKKILCLLNLDSTGSKTWFLDACGQTTHRKRRLLLSNSDIGVTLPSESVQLGLNFKTQLPEFFDGREMGEDVVRVLKQYLKIYMRIRDSIEKEAPLTRSAARAAVRFK
ncbi:MAG: hypothetical protein Q8P24_16380 [Desulfobacterales bacterium]|nr:hypothetical protein [Desulfobacterales bacterium]